MSNQQTTLSICIVTWNSMKFIKDCLESIFKQSIFLKDFDIKIAVNVVDNGSQDNTVDFIRKNYPQVKVLKNTNNLGFSRAYNQAIRMHETEWVLVLNVDMILEKDFLEKLISTAQKSSDKIGSFSGKILKAETVIDEDYLPRMQKTDKIDSCGLQIKKSRHIKNIGENEIDEGQYDNLNEVFGFSGACILFRREALESVAYRQEYFDEDFFAYQEDFDLAYRLQNAGWKAKFIPSAKIYHFRSAQTNTLKVFSALKIIKARRQKSQKTNYLSFRNHLWVLYKNEIPENFWRNIFYIFWFEFKKFIFVLLFEQKTLKFIPGFFNGLNKISAKRKVVIQNRKVSAEYIRSWFN